MKTFIIPALVAFAVIAAIAQSRIDPVTIDVVATDKAGFVKNLTAKDFHVWEDNKEQTVINAVPNPPGKHVIVLLFDNNTIAVNLQADIRGYVARFIDSSAGPNVYMEVASYLAGVRVLQPFTTDPALLKSSLIGTAATGGAGTQTVRIGDASSQTAIQSRTSSAPAGARATGQTSLANASASDSSSMGTQEMMESIRGLVESMATIKGRKTLILFSGGRQFSQDAIVQVNEMLAAANKNNVAIYGVSNNTAFAKTFADDTGATFVKVTQYLPEALQQIVQEQDAYYSVSYEPPADPVVGCHQLRVKSDAPGVELRARKSYCSPKRIDALAGTQIGRDLDAELTGTAAGGLVTSLQTPYFFSGAQPRLEIVLDTPGAGIKFRKEKGKFHGELNAAGAAYRKDGSVAARFSETMPFDFADQKQAEAFARLPFHYENQLTLPPGEYTVKAVISPGGDVWGKAEAAVAVESRDQTKLAMSGIALSRELRNATDSVGGLPPDMIGGETPLLAGGRQIVPTGNARFQKTERALFYAEIYEPSLAGQAPAQVSMRFRVLDRASGSVKNDSGVASVAGYVKPGNPVIGVASTVPTAQLTPGAYRLEITASHTSGPDTVVRSVDFDIN